MSAFRYVTTPFFLILPLASPALAQTQGAADCWRADEVRAAHVQNLQNLLMVESLKCRDTVPATLEAYNAFMTSKRDTIMGNKYLLQAHFVRQYGALKGSAAASDYDTKASNASSSSIITVERCETVGAFSRLAATAANDDLLALADMVAPGGPLGDCPANPALKPASMVIAIWKKGVPPPGSFAAAAAAKPTVTASLASVPVTSPAGVTGVPAGVYQAPAALSPVDAAAAGATPATPAAAVAAAAPVQVPAVEAQAPIQAQVEDAAAAKPAAAPAVSISAASALQAAATALAQAAAAMQSPGGTTAPSTN